MRSSLRRGWPAVLALPVALLAATPASAATVNGGTFVVHYFDVSNEANDVTVSQTATDFVFTDIVPLAVTGSCVSVNATTATCPLGVVEDISVDLGGMNDRMTGSASLTPLGAARDEDLLVDGGDGNDVITGGPDVKNSLSGGEFSAGSNTLTGGSLTDTLIGGEGPDQLSAGAGPDRLSGGLGNDSLSAGPGDDEFFDLTFSGAPDGADAISGGTGFDRFHYDGRIASVGASLGPAPDGAGCPGSGCEGDAIGGDVEALEGGEANDVLTGDGGDNSLRGMGGDDVVDGAGGADQVNGNPGDDVVRGGAGDDFEVSGDEGEDLLSGGAGDDVLLSGRILDDADDLRGGKGTDLADYRSAGSAVRIDLDGRADDGVAGENDNVRPDVEDVLGTPFNDVLTGSKRSNELVGGDGNDRIAGKAGLDGLSGGRGRDRLAGGKGIDLLEGEAGPDRITSRDNGADQVFCGSSIDRVKANRGDRIAADCDKVALRR